MYRYRDQLNDILDLCQCQGLPSVIVTGSPRYGEKSGCGGYPADNGTPMDHLRPEVMS